MPLHSLHRLWRLLPAQERRRALLRLAAAIAPRPDPAPLVRDGVVVLGELGRASGLGEGARQILAGCAALGVPTWTSLDDAPPAAALLLHLNAPQTPGALLRLGRRAIRARRVIGFWNWELPAAPPEWGLAAPFVHEVWTPSRFTAAALDAILPGRVRIVPYPLAVRPPEPAALGRAAFGLPPAAFVTLCVFSLASSFARKNPLAAIAAHRAAFGERPDRVLVIKLTDPDHFPADYARLQAACAGIANICIEPRTLPRGELHALMAASDVVLALHRSEGFGLVPAEAMLLGRAVVATDWSASTEFLDGTVGVPVPARLVPIEDARRVYTVPGAVWAAPDVAAAAAALTRLAADPAWRAELGARAQAAALVRFGPAPLAEALRSLGLAAAEPAGQHAA